jgi:glycosyltransferase involved in cell wall biosynthesis
MGVPLITSNGPGMNEIGKHGVSCLYCDVGNIMQISDAISSCYLDTGKLRAMEDNGKAEVKKFCPENFCNHLAEIYGQC